MAAKLPVINDKLCMACRICVSACPFGCLINDRTGVDYLNKAYPRLALKETCTGCGICSKECPVGAITMVAH